MTQEAKAKIDALEAEYKLLLDREKRARLRHDDAEADALMPQITALSGEIARAYYAGLHS